MISILISGQYGDPKADKNIWPVQKRLNDLFEKRLTENNNSSELLFSVVLRVSGKITDFRGDGPERIQFAKKDSEITIDYVIPEMKWRNVDPAEIEYIVVNGVFESLELLIEKAESLNHIDRKNILDGELASVFDSIF